jgi:hypothetical protein
MNCRACPALVAAPFRYCPDHAPAHRATAHRSYVKHRDARLAYQHARNAKPPVVDAPCLECSGPVPPYASRHRTRLFCSTKCRNRHDDHKRTPRQRARKVAI